MCRLIFVWFLSHSLSVSLFVSPSSLISLTSLEFVCFRFSELFIERIFPWNFFSSFFCFFFFGSLNSFSLFSISLVIFMYTTLRDTSIETYSSWRAMCFFLVVGRCYCCCLDYLQLFYDIISTKCHNNNEVLVEMLYIIGIWIPQKLHTKQPKAPNFPVQHHRGR